MSESELWFCKQCGVYHEALTQEVGSYMCPNRRAKHSEEKGKSKVLDKVMRKCLTKINSSSKTEEPKRNLNGDPDHDKEER